MVATYSQAKLEDCLAATQGEDMRRIVMFNRVTADGYFAGADACPAGVTPEEELGEEATIGVPRADTILFGRRTYEMFAGLWPRALDDSATPSTPRTYDQQTAAVRAMALFLNETSKLVFSKTLREVSWQNSRILGELDPRAVGALKQQRGEDIVVLGSGSIVSQLTQYGLIDEYQLVVSPVFLGSGRPLISGVPASVRLRLLEARLYPSGAVKLRYARWPLGEATGRAQRACVLPDKRGRYLDHRCVQGDARAVRAVARAQDDVWIDGDRVLRSNASVRKPGSKGRRQTRPKLRPSRTSWAVARPRREAPLEAGGSDVLWRPAFSRDADQWLVSDDSTANQAATEKERAISEVAMDDSQWVRAGRRHRLLSWLDHLLISAVRWLIEHPEGILPAYVHSGANVLEVGCGAGFFTIPLARMVGSTGHVLCIDFQQRTLAALDRHAQRAGLRQRIEARQCDVASLGLADRTSTFDLALLIHVLHKLPNPAAALAEIRVALAPEGHVLLIEWSARVSSSEFRAQIEAARAAGLVVESRAPEGRYRSALLRRAE